jgi:hypothetical protein
MKIEKSHKLKKIHIGGKNLKKKKKRKKNKATFFPMKK